MTELLIIGSCGQSSKIHINSITVEDSIMEPVKNARGLGSWFDEHMAIDVHIGNICNKPFKGLYNNRQIRRFLSTEATKILIHAFMTSHLDYCNSFLKVPITPKIVLARNKSLHRTKQDSAKISSLG